MPRRIRLRTPNEPDCSGRWRCGTTTREPATRSTRSSPASMGSSDESRTRQAGGSASSRVRRSTMRVPRSWPNAARWTPARTTSGTPPSPRRRIASVTSSIRALRSFPRSEGTTQNAHRRSQPSWIFRKARVLSGSKSASSGRPAAGIAKSAALAASAVVTIRPGRSPAACASRISESASRAASETTRSTSGIRARDPPARSARQPETTRVARGFARRRRRTRRRPSRSARSVTAQPCTRRTSAPAGPAACTSSRATPARRAAAAASIRLTLQPSGAAKMRRALRGTFPFVDTAVTQTIIDSFERSCARGGGLAPVLESGMKFLLVEYEPRYLERIRHYLASQFQTVELVVARDGEEGLELYRKSRPDLVLISSVLPKVRTPEVIKGMQATGPTPPILLMMSGYKGRNKRADAQRVGATSILEKPFSEDVFQAEIAMALGLRPGIEMASSPGPPSDPGTPLLSADDIFSDVLTGLDEAAPPVKPVSREMPAPGSVEKRLHDTLSGLIPPKKPVSGSSAPFPSAERPERPVERTTRVNVAEAMASLAARPQQAPRSGESQARGISSVDKLLNDTLSGLMPLPKTTAAAPPVRPREIAREVSDETIRMKVSPIPPPVPPPMKRPIDTTRPVAAERPASSPGAFGRYQLLQKIGAGGMAEVYKARMRGEQGFEKIVAIKRIVPHMATNAEFVTMFVDEAKLAAQLNHNNITHIYDLGKVDAWHYIAMEYVEGKDLRTLLKLGKERGFPLAAELALFIAAKIASALDYAHRRPAPDGSELNLVHRDVSPQNILISDEGDIKLCDFGIAKAASKVSTTISGALKGKLQYMSPEQAWGKRLDRRSDIFSLGSVLYEMLTGAPLFEGDTDMSVLESVREGEVAPPTSRGVEVPKRVDQIVLKALAKK